MKAWNGKCLQSFALAVLIAGSLAACFFLSPPTLSAAIPNCYQVGQCWNSQYPNDYGVCAGPFEDGHCGCYYSSDDSYVDQDSCQIPKTGG
jgi:hypothetical protein